MHKCTKNPPGRPIIAGIGSLTSNLSQYIDKHLQKFYLRDTTSLIQEVQTIEWKSDYQWATLDVTSLYTNIPHDKGILCIKTFLDMDVLMPNRQFFFIHDSIEFILKHNYFNFNGQIFIQTTGTAMGTRFAPSFANM